MPFWAVFAALSALSLWFLIWVYQHGWTLYYGDAQAHLNIARRIIDGRYSGYEQIGTVWLPLPHLLMVPLVGFLSLWRSGLAGALPSAACFVTGGLLLFSGVRRLWGTAPAVAATAAYALNPNLLYLQSTPMTEPFSLCWLMGLFWALVAWQQERRWAHVLWLGVFALCGTLTRYEFWFLLPFLAVAVWGWATQRRWLQSLVFCLIAGAGPVYWIAHNWILFSNPLEFYDGYWSAKMIYQRALDAGGSRYPGDHDWKLAWYYYKSAGRDCVGGTLYVLGWLGLVVGLVRRAWAPALLLLLVPGFYVLSMHGSGTPIFVPELWPKSHYNTRYGLNILPILCFGVAALITLVPRRVQWGVACAIPLLIGLLWLRQPAPEAWITWKESEVNSTARREWTQQAAQYLQLRYRRGAGILMIFGDQSGILREAGIPLREAFFDMDRPNWVAAVRRPEYLLMEEWAIAIEGDPVSIAMRRLTTEPKRYACVKAIRAHGAPTIEIWRHIR